MKLRADQRKAVDYVMRHIAAKKSILVQAPVASGKTVVFAELIRRWVKRGKRVLVLAHRKELLDQAAAEIRLPVSIIRANATHLENPDALVQVASIQTLYRRDQRPKADVIIVDEAHHSPAKSYLKVIGNYPEAYLVGLTATPIYSGGNRFCALADCFEDLYVSISPAEAVERKIIAPWRGKVWVPPSLSEVEKKGADFDTKQLGKAMSQRHIVGDIVGKWKQYARGASTILFAATRAQCKVVVKAFRKANVDAEYLDGKSRPEIRAATLARFNAGEFPVLCNVGLFTEGTNIPRAKCIVLARPTFSLTLYLQMVGRGRRVWKDKTCVIHDHGGLLGQHMGPDDTRDWRLGGKSDGKGLCVCRRCDTAFPRGERCPECPESEVSCGGEGPKDPAWILTGYEYDAEKFLAMRDEKRKEAIEQYQSGVGSFSIGRTLGVSSQSILKWVKAAGCEIRLRPFLGGSLIGAEKLKMVMKYLDAGRTIPEVEKLTGISRPTIRKYSSTSTIKIKRTRVANHLISFVERTGLRPSPTYNPKEANMWRYLQVAAPNQFERVKKHLLVTQRQSKFSFKCQPCGGIFFRKNFRQKFCSRACALNSSQRARRTRRKK